MQSLAAEFNLSETTFVLPPADPANTARVRIFNRTRRDAVRRPSQCRHRLGAGRTGPRQGRRAALRGDRRPGRGRRRTPTPSPSPRRSRCRSDRRCRSSCWPAASASTPATSSTTAHRPVSASVGNSFVIAEVTGAALTRAAPDIGRFREAAQAYTAMGPNRLPLYLYAHDGERAHPRAACSRRCRARSRTRRPAAPRRRLPPCCCRSARRHERRYDIVQGVEMGRPSRLLCTARRARRRHPRHGRRRLRAGAEGRGLAIGRLDDVARAREVDDDVADPLVAADDRDAVGRQPDQRAASTGTLPVSSGVTLIFWPAFRPLGSPSSTLAASGRRRLGDLERLAAPLISAGLPLPNAFMRSDQSTILGSRSSGDGVSPAPMRTCRNHTGL